MSRALSRSGAPERRRHPCRSAIHSPEQPRFGEVTGGETLQILVVVTTLDLDETSENYNSEMVDVLSAAAQEYFKASDEVDGFLLATRAMDWDASHM